MLQNRRMAIYNLSILIVGIRTIFAYRFLQGLGAGSMDNRRFYKRIKRIEVYRIVVISAVAKLNDVFHSDIKLNKYLLARQTE